VIAVESPLAYLISAVEGFEDPAAVARYAELTGPSIATFGGHFVVSNTAPVFLEGDSSSASLSMVEFPSMDRAKAWYDSPEYAEARAMPPDTFRGRLLMIVEGNRPA